ncbi:MAG: zinc ABC transporter substrate-binding protein [Desmonostoc vinosum HA7617-LM4]|jgi:ABC-type Zn uptake system ZnuABC Zn-binding protein ZnuA|nr:zinc ABC transporter substrate-binding protein [Desmonostoc vinosum HA7617-LM4]
MSKTLLINNYLRATLLALTIGFVGCGSQAANTKFTPTISRNNENLPRVVATTTVLCDLIKQVAENTINLTCLISPDADPHIYQPNPEDRKAIEQANLILYNGYNLEPSLIKTIKATKNSAPKIAVSQLAVSKPQKYQESGKRITDPHVWHNTKNTIKMVEVINNNLSKLVPSNAKTYSNNTKNLTNELLQLDSWIKSRIASIPVKQRKLVTTHNALNYYVKAYGLSSIGSLEGISTEKKPTPARVKNLVANIKRSKVRIIFIEKTINSKLIESVASQTKVKISENELYTDGLGEPGSSGATYQKMMAANTRTIVEALGGTYLIFEVKSPQ